MLPLGLRRRFSLTTLTTLLLFFSPLGSGDTNIQVSVQANQAWTDTGIDLALGSNVTITASGTIRIAGSDPGKTPVGVPECSAPSDFVAPGLPCWSLIGRIGSGTSFYVGTTTGFSVTTSGRLFLGVNDNLFPDNSGSWATTVTVTSQAGQSPVIALLGDNPLNHTQGCPFISAGATANDAEDGDLTHSIIITGTENLDNPGLQILTYSVTDSSGLSDVESRQVVVFGVIGTPGCLLGQPGGKAPNLIVYVHGCCTNVEDVNTLRVRFSEAYKGKSFLQENGGWEIVVWDWSKDTTEPIPGPAYDKAELQAADLNIAISSHSYKYIHLIGHSAGARLIDIAAKNLAGLYSNVPSLRDKPFIHLTFLDACRPVFDDYGNLEQENYPKEKHYAEHYVDVNNVALFTNDYLPHAFNFDITNWDDKKVDKPGEFGHQWPVRWYTRSIKSPDRTGGFLGFSLSLEGGNEEFCTLADQFPPGGSCPLRNAASAALCGNIVPPAQCR